MKPRKTGRRALLPASIVFLIGSILILLTSTTAVFAREREHFDESALWDLLFKLNSDLQELEKRLTREVIPAVRGHSGIVQAVQPYLGDRFTSSWNGIVLQGQQPVYTDPDDWKGYWELKLAGELISSDPARETYWPLVENPGLVEMITMDLQYLEGTAYAAATNSFYTDTLVSISHDWFTALYTGDYDALVPMTEKVTAAYALQHNLTALITGKGSLLEVTITPPAQGQELVSGKVFFKSRAFSSYGQLLNTLDELIGPTGDISLAAIVVEVATAVGDEEALELREEQQSQTEAEVEPEAPPVSPSPKPGGLSLIVVILWPVSVLAAAAGTFYVARRLRLPGA